MLDCCDFSLEVVKDHRGKRKKTLYLNTLNTYSKSLKLCLQDMFFFRLHRPGGASDDEGTSFARRSYGGPSSEGGRGGYAPRDDYRGASRGGGGGYRGGGGGYRGDSRGGGRSAGGGRGFRGRARDAGGYGGGGRYGGGSYERGSGDSTPQERREFSTPVGEGPGNLDW